jgi:hypothetical protein
VALKFLPETVRNDPDAVRDLKHETRRCLELTHANIVRVYDFVEDGTMAAIAMEYVDGSSLAAWKAAHPQGCVTVAELSPLVTQLCEALQYAHATARIVHRDLKPANLLLTRDGRLKITDFGIARSLAETKTRLTGTDATSGTPAYMSPQQLLGQRSEPADDIYALGATLYELLTSKPPFYTGSMAAQIREISPPRLNDRRRELGINGPAVPAAWEKTVLACLAKKAGDRPASAANVLEDLGLAPRPTGSRQDNRIVARAHAPLRRRLLKVTAGASLLALIAAGCLLLIRVQSQHRQATLAQQQEQKANSGEMERQRLEAETARLRAEKGKAEAALAQSRAEQEQRDHADILARIEGTPDSAPPASIAATDLAVKEYLAGAPARFLADVAAAWASRQLACADYRAATAPGCLVVRTTPDGADVQVGTLPWNKSPLTVKDQKPGRYPVRIRSTGYEDWNGEAEIKGTGSELSVSLVRSRGRLVVETDPTGLHYRMQGADRAESGTAGTQPHELPTGRYQLTVSRRGFADVTRSVEVRRNSTTVEKVVIGGLITGTWAWALPGRGAGQGAEITLTLSSREGRLTGSASVSGRIGGADPGVSDLSFDNGQLTFTLVRDIQGVRIASKYTGRLDGDVIRGAVEIPSRAGQTLRREWEARRVR